MEMLDVTSNGSKRTKGLDRLATRQLAGAVNRQVRNLRRRIFRATQQGEDWKRVPLPATADVTQLRQPASGRAAGDAGESRQTHPGGRQGARQDAARPGEAGR